MRSFDQVLDKYFPGSFGRWQTVLVLTVVPIVTQYFIIFDQLAFLTPNYHCQQPILNATFINVVNLSIPYKDDPKSPPKVGQAWQPCLEYDIDDVWAYITPNMSQTEMLDLRDRLYPNLTTRTCSQGVIFNTTAPILRRSLAQDFETVCNKEHFVTLSSTLFYIGMLCGFFLSGPLADNFGRRVVLLVTSTIGYFLAGVTALSPNIFAFIAFRFSVALLLSCSDMTGSILVGELLNKDGRNVFYALRALFLCLISRPSLTVLFYFLQDWRWTHFAFCYPGLLIFIGFFYWIESPRWLLSKGRVEESFNIMITLLSRNKQDITSFEAQELMLELTRLARLQHRASSRPHSECEPTLLNDKVEMNDLMEAELGRRPANALRSISAQSRSNTRGLRYIVDLLGVAALRQRFLMCVFMFFMQTFIYYGISFYAVKLEGNPYVVSIALSFMVIPSAAVQYLTYRFYDRKWPMVIFYMISTAMFLTGLLLTFFNFRGYPVIIACTIGQFVLEAVFTMFYIRIPELLPSTHRCTAFGFASCIGRLGSVAAFYVKRLDQTVWALLPLTVFSSGALITTVSSFFMPSGRGLMQDVILKLP